MRRLCLLLSLAALWLAVSPAAQGQSGNRGAGFPVPLHPEKDARNELRRALQLEALGRYEQAFQIFRGLFFRMPKNRSYLQGALRCLKRMKDSDRLLEFLQSALQVLPGNPVILAELASVRFRQGAEEEALSIWKGIVGREKADPQTYRVVATAMRENGLRDEAESLYR